MVNRMKMKSMINKTEIRNTKLLKHLDFANCRQTFLLISFILTCSTGYVIVEQQNIIASLRSSVTLKCIVTSENIPTLSWFFKDNKIFLHQKTIEDDKIVQKYTLSNTSLNSTRTYNLQIRNVLPTDDGMYTCQFTIAENRIKRHIKLAIKYLSENPFVSCQFLFTSNTSIQHGISHQAKNTRYQTQLITGISCSVNIGKNMFVNITIMKSAQHKPDLIQVYSGTKEQSDAVDGVNISYPVDVTGLDGWQFWCVAHQSMMLQSLNSSTPTLIKPQVSITKLITDSEDQFKCEIESYPDATFRWITCEEELENISVEECRVLNSTSSYLTLVDIGAVDDVLILICEAQNAVGTGQSKLTITRHTEPANMTTTDTEPKGTTISVHARHTNEMRGGSHLVLWSIGGGFVLLFGLALTIISLYFGKESKYIKRNLSQQTPVRSKKAAKPSDAHQNFSNAGFGIISYSAYTRQIAAAELASLCATPVKTKTECRSYDEYHSESEYDLRGSSELEDVIYGHTARLMAETQPLYHTLDDPNGDNNSTTKASSTIGDHDRSVFVAALGNANSTTTTTTTTL